MLNRDFNLRLEERILSNLDATQKEGLVDYVQLMAEEQESISVLEEDLTVLLTGISELKSKKGELESQRSQFQVGEPLDQREIRIEGLDKALVDLKRSLNELESEIAEKEESIEISKRDIESHREQVQTIYLSGKEEQSNGLMDIQLLNTIKAEVSRTFCDYHSEFKAHTSPIDSFIKEMEIALRNDEDSIDEEIYAKLIFAWEEFINGDTNMLAIKNWLMHNDVMRKSDISRFVTGNSNKVIGWK